MPIVSFIFVCCSAFCFANYAARKRTYIVNGKRNYQSVSTGVRG